MYHIVDVLKYNETKDCRRKFAQSTCLRDVLKTNMNKTGHCGLSLPYWII